MSIPPYLQPPPAAPPKRAATVLAAAALLLAGLACAVAFTRPWWSSVPGNAAATVAWNAVQQREYATKLLQEGLSDQAVRAFEMYLTLPGLTSQELAAVAYTIGKVHMDAARYEDALAAFYRVELADAAAPQRAPAARAIVTCLERLGRASDARYVLDQETALRKPAGRTNERATVLARIGDDDITLADITALIESMPPADQQRYATPAAKRDLLHQLVNQRLLAAKARALGLDALPDIRRQVERFQDQLLVQRYFSHELAKAAPVATGDVQLFYEAHPELFSTPARAHVTALLHPTPAAAATNLASILAAAAPPAAFTALLARAAASNVVTLVVDAQGEAGPLGHAPELAAAALGHAPGIVTNVVATRKGFAVLQVTRSDAGAHMPFAAVREQAERLYKEYKRELALQTTLEELRQTYRVQQFDDRLGGPASSPAATP